MAEWIADHTLEGGALSCTWQDYKSAFVQYFPALPPCVNRDTWSALTMDGCGGFHKYVQVFQQQAAEVCPSEAEKIHTFKKGLSSAFQNAVLLDTTTKEPWTAFEPLLRVATSYANAMLAPNRRTQSSGATDAAGRSRSSKDLRSNKGKQKRSASSQGRQDRDSSNPRETDAEAQAWFWKKQQTTWCRKTHRCDECLQLGHNKADCPDTAKSDEKDAALDEFQKWRKANKIFWQPRRGNGKGKGKAPFQQ